MGWQKRFVTKNSFTYYGNKAKNKIKIKSSAFFSILASVVDFGKSAMFLFGT